VEGIPERVLELRRAPIKKKKFRNDIPGRCRGPPTKPIPPQLRFCSAGGWAYRAWCVSKIFKKGQKNQLKPIENQTRSNSDVNWGQAAVCEMTQMSDHRRDLRARPKIKTFSSGKQVKAVEKRFDYGFRGRELALLP